MRPLRMLVITDIHYARRASVTPPVADDHPPKLGAEFLRRAISDARTTGPLDAIALLGDLVADGNLPGADVDMFEVAETVLAQDMPVIVVPGNHDPSPAAVFKAFNDRPGAHEIHGYLLYSFVDQYDADNRCTRRQSDLEAFLHAGAENPIIALQHPPIHPEVDCSEYPYMPINTAAIRATYERANVLLSLSGHFHSGTDVSFLKGVTYLTCSALGNAPFAYYVITLDGRRFAVEQEQLQLPRNTALFDYHTHSHFGYCAVDVHPVQSLERAHTLGLTGVACVEHASQLYLEPEGFWSARHINDPHAIENARHEPGNRMSAFRKAMQQYRSEELLVGLEVECDCEGKMNLLDEDRHGWDMLLGAIHWLPANRSVRRDKDFKSAFMFLLESLLAGGIDILAHPFRIFTAGGRPSPSELHRPIAAMLKDHGVAAEINCHSFLPDPEFFRICAEVGVRLVLSSDAHRLYEVGAFNHHLRLLKSVGLSPEDIRQEHPSSPRCNYNDNAFPI